MPKRKNEAGDFQMSCVEPPSKCLYCYFFTPSEKGLGFCALHGRKFNECKPIDFTPIDEKLYAVLVNFPEITPEMLVKAGDGWMWKVPRCEGVEGGKM